jgi:hypothetical protein
LRLQLLRPEQHPALYEALYGLLMLLPQSSAFATLRNRLNSVSSMGILALLPLHGSGRHTRRAGAPSPTLPSLTLGVMSLAVPRKRDAGEEGSVLGTVNLDQLMIHFRAVQQKHDAARRLGPCICVRPRAHVGWLMQSVSSCSGGHARQGGRAAVQEARAATAVCWRKRGRITESVQSPCIARL